MAITMADLLGPRKKEMRPGFVMQASRNLPDSRNI
jgi:hypothetical protein